MTITHHERPVAVLSPAPTLEKERSPFNGSDTCGVAAIARVTTIETPGPVSLRSIRSVHGSAHAASRSIFLRRSCSASREATAVPATLVSRGEIEPWNLLLVREHDDGLERQTVKQEVRQHDGRQPCLVAARNAVEEHGSPVAAGKVVAARHVRRHGRNRRHARS